MSKKYPKTIYVQVQGESTDEYFRTEDVADGLDDGKIAVYVLKEIKTKRTKIRLD